MNPTYRRQQKSIGKPIGKRIQTNLMEIVQALASQTNDDNIVLTAIKDLFQSNRVRLANTLAPLRLVEAAVPARSARGSRRRLS